MLGQTVQTDTDFSLGVKDVNGRKRKEAPSAAQLQAPAAKRAAIAREPSQEDATWEDFAAQGDTALHCLGHKLSLKKRDTAAAIRDLTLAYIKRLRALGWHLHAQCERCCDHPLPPPVPQPTHILLLTAGSGALAVCSMLVPQTLCRRHMLSNVQAASREQDSRVSPQSRERGSDG